MPTTISRQGEQFGPITLTNSVSTTQGFSTNLGAGAMILVDSWTGGAGTFTVTFYTKADQRQTTTYLLTDSTNSAISHTTQAGRCFELPDALFSARYILPVISSGSAVIRYVVKG